MIFKNISILIVILSLFACAVGSDYKRPEVTLPTSWFGLKKFFNKPEIISESNKIDHEWWYNFDDPVLNQIIEITIENNLDLKIAESKIIESRANLRKQKSYLAPDINFNNSASRSSKIFNPVNPNKHKPISIFDSGFDASWEIDLFGAVRRAEESFVALSEATQENKKALKISLIAEAARNYMELRNLQNQIEFHKKSISALERIVKLSEDKKNSGLISDIDYAKFRTALINEKSVLPDLDVSLNIAILRLEILAGKQPGELRDLLKPTLKIAEVNKEVVAAAPLDLLRNRPDIKEAEHNLASATALEGVAISARYPKISLTGFFGFQNTNAGNLFKNSSRVFSNGAAISLPIFDFGAIESDIKISQAKKEQALLSYKSAILKALEDVENALIAYANSWEKLQLLYENLEITELNMNLIKEKYQRGLIGETDLLQAKIDFYQIHNSLIQGQSDLNINLITLYKSLGGGWEVDSSDN